MSLCTGQLEPPAIPVRGSSVCAVTVTYGDRQHLVRQVVLALLQEAAIRKIVVVSNGAHWNVQEMAEELGSDRIDVVDLETNRGSAAGFGAGIKRACELGTDFIWLLDDDNEPQQGTLSKLLVAYARLRNDFAEDGLAVLAFRSDHQAGVAAGLPVERLRRRPSSFLGFHVFDVPYKLWRRMPWHHPRPRRNVSSLVEMAEAPYGGLLFRPALVERHGLPREDFVLYADDTEFTYRITRDGGAIRVVTSAALTDLEVSWRIDARFGSLHSWLSRGSDLRAFYSARNQTYFERYCFSHNRFVFWVNRQAYCFALWLFALLFRRFGRYKLLHSAIREGLKGRLGVNPEFPL